MHIGHFSGILALDSALLEIVPVGVFRCALDVGADSAVSYTHLDVYKRQMYCTISSFKREEARSVFPSPASAIVAAWFSAKYRLSLIHI